VPATKFGEFMMVGNKEKKIVSEVLFSVKEINCSSSLFARSYAMRLYPVHSYEKGNVLLMSAKLKRKRWRS
jgi:hypothetical protein